jgi:hypothetical protein
MWDVQVKLALRQIDLEIRAVKAVIALAGRRDAGKSRRLIACFWAALMLSTICCGEPAMSLLKSYLMELC